MAKDYLSIAPVQQFDPTACWTAALQWWARAIGGAPWSGNWTVLGFVG